MYVYRTPKFNEELSKAKELSSRVDNLCSQLETMSYLDAKARFKKLHLYLKRKEGNFRLIARTLKIEREPILCFLKVYNRGEPGYRHFLEAVKQHTELFNESQIRPELSQWLVKEKLQNKTSQPSLSPLPDNLRIWLERPSWQINSDDLIIHETEVWGNKFNQPEIRSQASHYLELIEEVLYSNSLGEDSDWENIKIHGKNNHHILYLITDSNETLSPKILLLIAPLLENPTRLEIQEIIQLLIKRDTTFTNVEYQHNSNGLDLQNKVINLDYLITNTKRSYPCYLILEENFWLKIQDGNGVNLTLSDEEQEILNSVSTDKPLPLFLNGRAGSGKSTMLFYLFAYYCNKHLQLCHEQKLDILAQPHPLFLTYSNNLSDFAKDKVQFLLRHHHLFVEDTSKLQYIPDIRAFFQPFRSFLLNLLPPKARKFFPEENYVSFYAFKEFCAGRRQKISPEKCWLVIQNFIKGYELDCQDHYLEDEHYYSEIVPKKASSISLDEFVEIRDRVWKSYQQYLKRNQLWDDRDLIRTVLSLGSYQPKYTVIFCDEAQDFTRLELQLIMRLSAFSNYDLEQEHIFSLPFAFAGDPLQTLNPSGFRWESFKAAFYDEVLTPLDLQYQASLKIELTPLKYNYRSVASIVKVNNLIQLWRKILFDIDDIYPQQSRKVNHLFCQKFIINDDNVNHLEQYLKNTIILIPCDEGEELDFIQHDRLLRNFWNSKYRKKIPWNILSAISAKGLEFKQVVLYKFGERCPKKLWEIKENPPEKEKYFLNKLYVAASRATESLFIIDSEAGEQNLWVYASESSNINSFLSRIDNQDIREQWRENTDLIYLSESLSPLNSNDLESNALTFEIVGIQGQNIDYLERAIAAYETNNNQSKANWCRAWKLKLEKEFLSAGKLFLELNKAQESWECFWQGLAWKELKQIIKKPIFLQNSNSENSPLLLPMLDFMAMLENPSSLDTVDDYLPKFLAFTDFLTQESQEKLFIEEYHNKPWKNAIASYQFIVEKLLEKPLRLTEQIWREVAKIMLNWEQQYDTNNYAVSAQCLILSRDYDQALFYWEKLSYPEQAKNKKYLRRYYLVKAKLTQLPQSLEYLAKAEKYFLIINLWLNNGKKVEHSWLKYIAIAYEATNHFEQAFIVYCHLDDPVKVRECWEQIKPVFRQAKYLKKILSYYLDKKHWHQAIAFAEKYQEIKRVSYIFLYTLGQSQLIPDNLTKSEKQRYQKFIQHHILDDSRWQKYFNPQYLGIVLEKIGSFVDILTFYQQYIKCSNSELGEFSRHRWLATKYQQISYLQETNQITKVKKAQQELTRVAKIWKINIETVSKSIPLIELDRLQKKSQNQTHKTVWCIKGLPSDITLKTIAQGIYQFQLHNLIVRLMPNIKQIAIADFLSHKLVRFDGLSRQLQIDSTIISLSNNQSLSLKETLGNYSLTLIQANSVFWELAFDNYEEKIIIEFRNL